MRPLLLALSCLLLACATSLPARGDVVMREVQLPSRELRYASGLRVLVEQDARNPVVAVVAVVGAGSTSDPAGKEGLAHVVEHLAFRARHAGSPSVWTRLEHLGAGRTNASTGLDSTSYETLAPREALAELLRLEGQRLSAPLAGVTPEVFAVEREVVRSELRQRNETGYVGQVYGWAQAAAFPADHPYARPVPGTHASLGALALADAQAFVDAAYRPDNVTVVVTGDVDPDGVDALLRQTFPAAWVTDGAPPALAPRLPAAVAPPVAPAPAGLPVFEASVATPELYLTWPLPRGFDDAAAVQAFVEASLSAELGRAMARDGDIANVSATLVPGTRASLLLVRVPLNTGAHPEATAELVLDQVLHTWLRGSADGVRERQEQYLRRHRTVTTARALEAEDLLARTGRRALLAHFTLDAGADARAQAALAALDAADVADFAYAWLKRERARVLLVRPGESGVPALSAPAPLPSDADAGAPPAGPLPEALARTPEVRALRLQNGLEVLLAPRPGLPLVTVGVALPGGELSGGDAPGAPELAEWVGHGVTTYRGTPGDWGVLASGRLYRDHSRHVMAGAAGNVGNMLAMLAEKLDGMGTTREVVQLYKESVLPWRKAQDARPEVRAEYALLRALYGDTPHGRAVTGEDVGRATQGQAEAWMDRVHRPGNAVAVVAGEFDPAVLEPLLRDTLGRWGGGGEGVPAVPPAPARPHARPALVLTPRPGATQGQVALACRLDDAGPAGAARSAVMAEVVRERLWRQVREQMGASYGFHTSVYAARGGATHLQVSGVVEVPQLRGALAAARAALEAPARAGLGEAEVARARARLLAQHVVALTTSAAWTHALLDARVLGWTAEDVVRRPEHLQAVRAEALRADFATCAERLVVGLTGDEGPLRQAATALESLAPLPLGEGKGEGVQR